MTRRLVPFAAAAVLALVLVPALPAAAAVTPTVGESLAPAQPYVGGPATDWTGGYSVNAEQVFSARYGLVEPDIAQAAGVDTALTDKWGNALDPIISDRINYLIWRYGDTTDAAEAAALAYLLHTWTAFPVVPSDLLPTNTGATIAYDIPFHLVKLSPAAQALVTSMVADSLAYYDSWVLDLTPPPGLQIGTQVVWTIRVSTLTADTGVPGVPLHVELSGAQFPGGLTVADVVTGANGSVQLQVTPTASPLSLNLEFDGRTASAVMTPAIDPTVASWIRRSANVTASGAGIGVPAAPAAVPEPELAETGRPLDLTLTATAVALIAGGLVLVALSRPRRGRHAGRPTAAA